MKKVQVKLKSGEIVVGDQFDEKDFVKLKQIFQQWKHINQQVSGLGGRNLNVPDVFSEALYCILFDAVRTNNTAHSYDCVNLRNGAGVQIKSASIINDCTSFGPKSTWDELYFIDFAHQGQVDGNVYVYKIDIPLKKIVLNTKKHETFEQQQQQGRRPRLSLKQIIKDNNIKPIKHINLN